MKAKGSLALTKTATDKAKRTAKNLRSYVFVVYRGYTGSWYWRCVAPNGKVVADGGEGYASRRNCRTAVGRLIRGVNNGALMI